jgi:hypothetical protein
MMTIEDKIRCLYCGKRVDYKSSPDFYYKGSGVSETVKCPLCRNWFMVSVEICVSLEKIGIAN